MIGSTLDKYEVIQKVGEGGMATVYRGRHATLDRDVAIKILHPHLSSSTRNRKRFEREARAIEHLRHPNVLEIYDYSGVDTGDCYIITEFVDGQTLTELMDRCRRLPSEVACTIGIALAEALAYAHQQGVLHRDLKPDNVMLRRDGRVKLMDFGIARFLDESQVTLTGALVGSPAFMSPEQAREDDLDPRSDLFSLGTLLYFLVTGHLPFSGSNPSLILKHIIEGNRPAVAELAPSMSSSLADVIERLMANARDERFPDATAVIEALRGCLHEVGFDPDEPRWALSRYLREPDAYEADLDTWLAAELLTHGRQHLDAGEHLQGLRLINRLLSMDDAHPDALALVQTFHGVADEAARNRRWLWVSAAVLVLVFGGLVWRWTTDAPDDGVVARLPTPEPTTPARVAAPVEPAAQALVQADTPEPVAATERPPVDDDAVAAVEVPAPARPTPRTGGTDAPDAPAPRPTRAPRPAEPVAPPVEAPPEPEPEPACIAFRSLDAVADIYLEGKRLRTTVEKGCIEVPPGEHVFTLRGPAIRDKEVRVTLAPGEQRKDIVDLERNPARVRFRRELSPACTVQVDDDGLLGTLDALNFAIDLQRPEAPHEVRLTCPDGTWIQRFARLDVLDTTFDGTEAP
ncbi:MAG: protein kinase [Alphaproteobacteria bacterium]|nr:protein kinase [Alphaproteobacteria bacterium]